MPANIPQLFLALILIGDITGIIVKLVQSLKHVPPEKASFGTVDIDSRFNLPDLVSDNSVGM